MNLRPLLLFTLVALAGCATQPAAQTPAYFATLRSMHVPPATLQRIQAGRVLSFSDVVALVQCGVPGDKIVPYLRSTRAPYNFTQPQIDKLLAEGADSTLVNYVGRSAGDFLIDAQNAQQQAEIRRNGKWEKEAWRDPYFNDPGYWGMAPFGFGFPGEWY
jgi:hypothetical protein